MEELLFRFREKKSKDKNKALERVMGLVPGLLPKSRVRVWPFRVMAVMIGVLLMGRLVQLTVVEGAYQRRLAEENRVVAVRRAAARGVLLDRNGVPLVRNVPSYKRQIPGTTVMQAEFEPISREEALNLSREAGERIFFDVARDYICGRACSLILGYMGEVDRLELETDVNEYMLGDLIGKSGMEKWYEKELRGEPGSELLEVDAQGQIIREAGKVEAVRGLDIPLTIDLGLQQLLYESFEGRSGAAVAQVARTGEVLALVSVPAFDPMHVAISLNEPDMPFFNRAIGGTYPPGSVFKVVTAAAGLEEGKIDQETLIEDTGEIVIDSYRFGNWLYDDLGRTDGSLNIVKALKRSNDIFFYRVGEFVGADRLAEWARLFGYEDDGGMGPMGAVKGLIPDPQWKERYKGERWFLGNTYHMSIGQGDVMVSPMQVNRMTGAVAAGGVLCKPTLLKNEVGSESCVQMNLQARTIDLITEGMKEACRPGGTATVFNDFKPEVACKTGTAEHTSKENLPHAWFTVMAPAEAPEIVLTVMIENAGQGSTEAAPIARKALEYWFSK